MKSLMIKKLMIIACMSGLSFTLYAQYNEETYQHYIANYANLAMQEMKRTGIPASIKLAQALLETNAGKSELAVIANNHFKLRCGKDWNGVAFYKIDDERNEEGKPILSCFKVFLSSEESYIDHSEYLMDIKNTDKFGFLFDLPVLDYRSWASGLDKAGYSNDLEYGSRLIFLIEKFELYDYDQMMVSGENYHASSRTYRTNEK